MEHRALSPNPFPDGEGGAEKESFLRPIPLAPFPEGKGDRGRKAADQLPHSRGVNVETPDTG